MAGPDPRRSSRARPLQSQSQQTSTTSSNSGRLERSTRSLNRNTSPQKSTPTASLSSEPPEESIATTDDIPTRSRRTRAKDEEVHPSPIISEIEMAQEDDEAVRCVCGEEEYPGPPTLEDLKHFSKDGMDLDSAFPSEITDDLAGFYVQCDICKVWQHGACVGLTNDETLPDEYYCEECRKDLHRVFTRNNGPPFSIYLPLARGSRAVSVIKEGTRSPKEKEGKNARPSSNSQSSKRRSTMNSRDAAYDEEEQLRRAIEASRETATESVDGSSRRPKRGRDDSEEKRENSKRPRPTSRSPSPSADKQLAGDDSDDALATRNGASKKSRAQANARNQQLKAEREEKERARAEQANKRKGRAERRRADDSDPSEEIPLAARAKADRQPPTATESIPTIEPPPSSQPSPDTPSASAIPGPSSKSKSSRPSHKKKGRNQYTKDKDDRDGTDSPARSQSRDVHDNHTSAPRSGAADNSKSHAKGKGSASRSPTMGEMKRRAQAMLDFITKTQLELVHENNPARFGIMPTVPAIKLNGDASAAKKSADNPEGASPKVNGNSGATRGVNDTEQEKDKEPQKEKTFEEMSVVEKMDKLTKDIIHWQNEYGS